VESEPVVGELEDDSQVRQFAEENPLVKREVLSCLWRLRRRLLQGIGCAAGSAKALLRRA
jgi:hypothetical protein